MLTAVTLLMQLCMYALETFSRKKIPKNNYPTIVWANKLPNPEFTSLRPKKQTLITVYD